MLDNFSALICAPVTRLAARLMGNMMLICCECSRAIDARCVMRLADDHRHSTPAMPIKVGQGDPGERAKELANLITYNLLGKAFIERHANKLASRHQASLLRFSKNSSSSNHEMLRVVPGSGGAHRSTSCRS